MEDEREIMSYIWDVVSFTTDCWNGQSKTSHDAMIWMGDMAFAPLSITATLASRGLMWVDSTFL